MHIQLLSRLKSKSGANIYTGLLSLLVSTALGLILPYLFITQFGSETNGLLNSIAQLFVYLRMLEAGVGAVSRQALYKPLAESDQSSVNGILSATKKHYKRTGTIYLLAVLVLSFVYPLLVDTELKPSTIILVILLEGFSSVWNYYIQAKYNVLLSADGRVYVLNIAKLFSTIVRNFAKIYAIYLGYDIVVVEACNLVVAIVESCCIILYFKKTYKWVSFNEKPNYQALEQKNAAFVQLFAWIVFNHTDVMLLTVLCRDLKIVSVYSVYSLAFTAIDNVLESIRNSYQYEIGQRYAVSQDEVNVFFHKYKLIYSALSAALFTTCYIIVSPFISLYTRNVSDTNYILALLPILFFAGRFLYSIREIYRQLIEASGHFKSTRYIIITEMMLNLAISCCLIPINGIYGALIGTIVSLAVGLVLIIRYCNKRILVIGKNNHDYYVLFCYICVFIFFVCTKQYFVYGIENYLTLIIRTALVSIVTLLLYFTIIGLSIKLGNKMHEQKQDRMVGNP